MTSGRLSRLLAALTAVTATGVTGLALLPPTATSAATPSYGGTLNVLGTGDVDYLDPNITYYSLGYSVMREFSRQLYTYPATPGSETTTVPDLATGAPSVSSDGRTYRITIRSGAMWNTSPARQVTAADVVRGVETTCNPWQPFGGLPDYVNLIYGFASFCRDFTGVGATPTAFRRYMNNHSVPGLRVAADDPLTVIFRLKHAAGYFPDMLTLPAFSPRPKEMLAYLPGSGQESQHTVSDGPYQVTTYDPTRRIVFTRNPAWDSATDPVRAAYVDKIVISETSDPELAQARLEGGTADADLYFGSVPRDQVPRLRANNDPNLMIRPEIASNPYLVFNTRSPRNNGALTRPRVRRALSFALHRGHLIGDLGGSALNTPLTHVLPQQLVGSSDFNLYPHSTSKAKTLLQEAHAVAPTLRLLYRPNSPSQSQMVRTIKADLGRAGVKVVLVASADADYYTRYLLNPRSAKRGDWDMAFAGWAPDWYGNAAMSFFAPLFDGRVLPPGSDNFGLFNNSTVNSAIDDAQLATDSGAASAWHHVDRLVMGQAPVYPISNPKAPLYHATQVQNVVYMPGFETADFSNVWLDPAVNG